MAELTPEVIAECRTLFDSVDVDGGGSVEVEELSHLFKELGMKVPEAKLREMIAEVDTDGGGSIDFDEFCQLVANQMAKEGVKDPVQEAKKAFELFDKDGSGTIDASELGDALRAMGQEVSDSDLKEMLAQADDDGTGEIEFEEFCGLMGIELPNKKPKPKSKDSASQPKAKVEVSNPREVLTKEEIQDLEEIFNMFDEDGGGEITLDELSRMMEGLGRKVEEDKLRAMMADVDEDGTGSIDLEEFLMIMAKDKANEDPLEEARKIFNMFDKDGGGTIDAQELGAALRAMGQVVNDDDVAKMLQDADDDGTGEIDFEEFCTLMGLGGAAPPKPKTAEEKQRRKQERQAKPDKVAKLSKKNEEKKRQKEEEEARKAEEERVNKESANDWSKFLQKQATFKQTPTTVEESVTIFRYDYALHKAAAEGDTKKVKDMVEGRGQTKADMNEMDDMGWNPLMWAIQHGQPEVAGFLIDAGCKVRVEDFDGRTPLHMAAMQGEMMIVQLLLTKKVGLGTKDKFGDSSLVWAAKKGNHDVAAALLKGKADVNQKAAHAETALHWAAKRGHTRTVQTLLRFGADGKAKDDADTTPADWAKSKELKAIINPPRTEKSDVRSSKETRAQARKFKQGLQSIKGSKGTKGVRLSGSKDAEKEEPPESGISPVPGGQKAGGLGLDPDNPVPNPGALGEENSWDAEDPEDEGAEGAEG
eukprot:CAMPEP_0184288178 /NCGR_PEP_ID=MMETSP1049-20130417/674_1 /TAXON_ID=77928 /ORGANISM="Proteomonas sulcata, Strain CCMP704" /LENGTH=702 /DNA_ID=CAMNT_0026594413 /DNA_START=43 /DNA_END=2147 /DNA_ORIENTATION=-